MQTSEQIKNAGDIISLTVVGATLAAWLPPIAAFLSCIWALIRIFESRTVREFLGKKPYGDN